MADELIVSVSGIRGVVGASLTPEIALAFAQAFGTYVDGGPVVLSRDGRPSGAMLHEAVAAGLLAAGCPVYPLSIAATPTVGLVIRDAEAAGGIQVTASHNPAPYNGLKLFGPRGMVLTAAEGQKVLDLYQHRQFRTADWRSVGDYRLTPTLPSRLHLNRVLSLVDVETIRRQQFPVLLDANHGAGGPLATLLLSALGCKVTALGTDTDGQFAHEPEPTETNLRGVAPMVLESGCVAGFALDPDADRLAIIDETGRYIGEELTLALAADFRLSQQRGPVVANMSTSRVIEDLAVRHGCPFHRAPVGEANVVEKMLAVEAVLGGEGNGGVIDPRVGLVRDPFVAMALVLNHLASTHSGLSEWVATLPAYHIVKAKHAIDRSTLPSLYARLQTGWPEAKVNREDGLRLDWPDRWVHVRPSNTEPCVRVIAEAPTLTAAEALGRAVADLLGR